jgi:hypothetical protein
VYIPGFGHSIQQGLDVLGILYHLNRLSCCRPDNTETTERNQYIFHDVLFRS